MKTTTLAAQLSTTAQAVLTLLEASLHFRVAVTLTDAEAILRNFQHYNEIPANLADIVRDVRDKIGPIAFKGANPNNGCFDNVRLSIGNENSLVIYIESNLFYRPGDTPERQKAVLESIGARFNADEASIEVSPSSVKARLWWD